MAKFLLIGSAVINIDEIVCVDKQVQKASDVINGKLGLTPVGYRITIRAKNGLERFLDYSIDEEAKMEAVFNSICIQLKAASE